MATSTTTNSPDVTTGQRLVLRGVTWDEYQTISHTLEGRHVRFTYDRGTLEFLTISPLHGHLSRLLAQLIFVLTEELGLPRKSFGDMTCDREDLDRGLEPDECFYITHEPEVRHKEHLELTTDPPPDLAIEIDVTHAPRNRLAIYAALGVKEVWRFQNETLTAQQLNEEGHYRSHSNQPSFSEPQNLGRDGLSQPPKRIGREQLDPRVSAMGPAELDSRNESIDLPFH